MELWQGFEQARVRSTHDAVGIMTYLHGVLRTYAYCIYTHTRTFELLLHGV
jgi:hypothetical protein